MTGEHRPNATPIVMHNYECAECGASIRITDDLVTVNVFGHAKAAHRTCPISPDTACHVCHEPTMRRQGRWVHTHGDESCGAGGDPTTDHGVYRCECETDAHEKPHTRVFPPGTSEEG